MLTLTNGLPLTATEAKMLSLLSDGQRHHRDEMHSLLWDEQSPLTAIHAHICNLRKKLKTGLQIICEFHQRNLHYRLIRLVGEARQVACKSAC